MEREKSTESILLEDVKRREFYLEQAEKISCYEGLIVRMEDVLKEYSRVAAPAVFENNRKSLLISKKIFKDNFDAYYFLLKLEVESILRRALNLRSYESKIIKNDMEFLAKVEDVCRTELVESIQEYYARLRLHADPNIQLAAEEKLLPVLQ